MAESEEELKSLLMRVKEESEKPGLKLNILKTKIMASGPITSQQIEGGKVEALIDFVFSCSKITMDSDCSHEIKRHLPLGRKVMINLSEVSEVAQSCLTLCDLMDCSLPGSSVHGIFQARILEWVAISFSRGSSWPRDQSRVSGIVGRRFVIWATREAHDKPRQCIKNQRDGLQKGQAIEGWQWLLSPATMQHTGPCAHPWCQKHPPGLVALNWEDVPVWQSASGD